MSDRKLSKNTGGGEIKLGPDPAQKRYWFLVWLVVFLPSVALGIVIAVFNVWAGQLI